MGLFGADFVNDVEMYPDVAGALEHVRRIWKVAEKEGVKAREAPVFIETVPDNGKHLKFVVTNLLLDGEEPRAVAPSASGILYLSNAGKTNVRHREGARPLVGIYCLHLGGTWLDPTESATYFWKHVFLCGHLIGARLPRFVSSSTGLL